MTFAAPIGVSLDHLTIKMNDRFFEKMATVVEGNERAELVPKMMKGSFQGIMNFEAVICHTAKRMCADADVALWDFAKTNNGKSLIMYPAAEDSFLVSNANNYSDNRVDSRIFGIMISIMTFNHASWHFHGKDDALSETFAELYHALSDAFYSTVDAMVHEADSDATVEEKEQISAMSSAVYSFLD